MSTENIRVLFGRVEGDAELHRKLDDACQRAVAQALAKISEEEGTPFSAEEFLAAKSGAKAELAESDLEKVSGGKRSFTSTGTIIPREGWYKFWES
jgi:predicted ribosomally synthesized peptide with nif11-like leader